MPLVRAGESQPLLLTARSFSDTPPGVYTADVVLSDGRTERTVALNVRVWDFTIPKEHGLLTLWGTVSRRDITAVWVASFSGCEQYRCWQEERTPNTTQFFQAHRLPAGWTIYGGGDSLYGTFWRSYVNNTSRLRELWEAGQRTFVVA